MIFSNRRNFSNNFSINDTIFFYFGHIFNESKSNKHQILASITLNKSIINENDYKILVINLEKSPSTY